MDAVEFLKQLKRRSKSDPEYYGEELNIAYVDPESLVSQVESWAKENPIKTRQSEFLKIFSNAPVEDDGSLTVFPCYLDKTMRESCEKNSCDICRREFWLQEVE